MDLESAKRFATQQRELNEAIRTHESSRDTAELATPEQRFHALGERLKAFPVKPSMPAYRRKVGHTFVEADGSEVSVNVDANFEVSQDSPGVTGSLTRISAEWDSESSFITEELLFANGNWEDSDGLRILGLLEDTMDVLEQEVLPGYPS